MSTWQEIADLFYGEQAEEGMNAFMAPAGQLSALPQAAEIVNPLFDALEQGDYLYAADLLLYETEDKKNPEKKKNAASPSVVVSFFSCTCLRIVSS